MKKKAFTLVELLVVIAIISLLMSILMPALSQVRNIAHRAICGTNLSGIGKSMLVYAQDYDERFPRAGGRRSMWSENGSIGQWDANTYFNAFGTGSTGGGRATITSSHYLLVKFSDVSPKQFVCKGDSETTVFKITDYPTSRHKDLSTVWDFGPLPTRHDSYTYHMPYFYESASYPVSMVSNPRSPISSDKNPFQDSKAQDYVKQYDLYVNLIVTNVSTGKSSFKQYAFVDPDLGKDPPESLPFGNSASHQREGQNVLYVDASVNFERHPNVGIEDDNIWLFWTNIDSSTNKPMLPEDYQVGDGACPGGTPKRGITRPMSEEDAFLVNDTPGFCE